VPEGLVLLLILGATSVLIFLGGNWKYPYLIFPLLVWAGLRLRQVGAATAVLVVGAIATWGTVHGSVPIGAATATQSVQILQALLAVVGISILMIAATLSERDVAEAEVEEAYRRTSEAAERLRELDATKNTFISAVAHDLRAPLATISGFSQALLQRLSDFSEDEVRDILERIGGNAERMSRMLANLLDLDRLERGDIEASLVQVDLSDLVLRIVHGLELDREIHVDRGHVMAWVDEVLMERVIENLILNALRHTPQTAAVWIHLARRPNGAEISVEDEGPGVPDEQKQLIFEAFKRGGNGAAVGTGLGLFLVTRFSELHGGKAWVEDRPGGGAVFRVFVPDRQGGTPERKVVTEPPGESSSVGQRRS
jgi:signal transduction histidine kinase